MENLGKMIGGVAVASTIAGASYMLAPVLSSPPSEPIEAAVQRPCEDAEASRRDGQIAAAMKVHLAEAPKRREESNQRTLAWINALREIRAHIHTCDADEMLRHRTP